eukprot:16445145-Heterocapsa_arctica.AAC.1
MPVITMPLPQKAMPRPAAPATARPQPQLKAAGANPYNNWRRKPHWGAQAPGPYGAQGHKQVGYIVPGFVAMPPPP